MALVFWRSRPPRPLPFADKFLDVRHKFIRSCCRPLPGWLSCPSGYHCALTLAGATTVTRHQFRKNIMKGYCGLSVLLLALLGSPVHAACDKGWRSGWPRRSGTSTRISITPTRRRSRHCSPRLLRRAEQRSRLQRRRRGVRHRCRSLDQRPGWRGERTRQLHPGQGARARGNGQDALSVRPLRQPERAADGHPPLSKERRQPLLPDG